MTGAQTPIVDEDTLFVLIDEALVAEGQTTGASLVEARIAIDGLVNDGTLRIEGAGYIARFPSRTPIATT